MVKTGSSRLLGFYFLGISVMLFYAFLFVMTFFYFFSSLSAFFSDELYKIAESFILSFRLVMTAVALAFPFALAIGIFVLKNSGFYHIEKFKKFLIFIDKSPLVLFGLAFFIVFNGNDMAFLLTLAFIACSKLFRRWTQQSNRVSSFEVETFRSLGMNFPEILKTLYLKRFFTDLYRTYFFCGRVSANRRNPYHLFSSKKHCGFF